MEKEESSEENNIVGKVEDKKENKAVLWLKRIGVLGFLFFLVKGLLWLALPTLLVWFAAK
jgi:hypothetical protein